MLESLTVNKQNPYKKLMINGLFSALSWFLPIILTVFGTPFIVKGLGYEQYGLYALILGFINYSFTFGIGRAVTKYVSEYNSQGKTEKVSEVISITFWLSLILCLIGSVLLILSADFIVRDVLEISLNFHDSSIHGLYIACAAICFLMVGQVFQSVLQAIHRFGSISFLITLNGFLLVIGNILLVWLGFGFTALLFWGLFTSGLNCCFYYSFARKYLPDFSLRQPFNYETLKLILNYSFGLIGYQIFSNLLLIFERSWITRKMGAESLTYYVVPMTLALYLHAFISSVVIVIFPVLSELQNDAEKLLKLYQRATKVIFITVSFLVLSMILASKLFLGLWINAEFAEKAAQILIFQAITYGIFSVISVVWQLAEGFGHPRFNALISFLWLAVSIPLMILLIKDFEIAGVAFSRFSANLLTIPFIFIGEKIFLGKIHWKFWLKLGVGVLIAGVISGVMEAGIFHYFPKSWITLIGGGIVGALIFAGVIWILKIFSDEEVNFLLRLLRIKRIDA